MKDSFKLQLVQVLRDKTIGYENLVPSNWTSLNTLLQNTMEKLENITVVEITEKLRWVAGPRLWQLAPQITW